MRDLHLEDKPVVLVLNKEDLLPEVAAGERPVPEAVREALGQGVLVSAVTRWRLDRLLVEIGLALERVIEVH